MCMAWRVETEETEGVRNRELGSPTRAQKVCPHRMSMVVECVQRLCLFSVLHAVLVPVVRLRADEA